MYDITILVPGLRTHFWQRLYNSIKLSCTNYSWELVLTGPFDPPDSFNSLNNVLYLKDYACPSVCMQKATLYCKGKLIFHTVDDGVLLPNSLDICLKEFLTVGSERDIMNMRYKEAAGFAGWTFDIGFYRAGNHQDLCYPGIDPNWNVAVQPLFAKQLFIYLGGFDCRFKYTNHSHHDFAFRVQKNGGKVYHSPVEVCNADHMPNTTGDHQPIHNTQLYHDQPLFEELYQEKTDRIRIDYTNLEQNNFPWLARFPKLYKSYEEMKIEQGYQV